MNWFAGDCVFSSVASPSKDRRVACVVGEGFGAREVLHFMEQTLESWQEHKRDLQERH